MKSAIKTMGRIQLNAKLSDDQVENIAAYLNSLTDRNRKTKTNAAK